MEKPKNVQIVGVCLLVGGIFSIMVSLGLALGSLCLWLPWIFGLVAGILAIVKGVKLLGEDSFGAGSPTAQAVLLIINIINMDPVSLTMGIIALVLAQDDDTRDHLDGVELLE